MTARDSNLERGAGAQPPPPDDYLWDARGRRDEHVAALERALSPLRWQSRPLMLDHPARPMLFRPRLAPLRAAAGLGLMITGAWLVSLFRTSFNDIGDMKTTRNTFAGATMAVRTLQGAPRIAGQRIADRGEISAGQWLETDGESSAQVAVGDLGTVNVEPDSRLRLVHAHADEQRLELARGGLSAFITAPPRLFIVDTPAAAAVDLGCAYRLSVDESGDGEIEVTLGWVSMENHGRESIVPHGAKCITRKQHGVGTPFYADASGVLIEALQRFDFDDGGDAALEIVLRAAAVRDSLTLWHLLGRTQGEACGRVFDRLATLTPPPNGMSRDAIVRGDQAAIDAWRDALVWSPSLPRLQVK